MPEPSPSSCETGAWRPGSQFPVLLDRYQILGTIGQGGMGTVFKGYHVRLKRFVAIKTLRIDQYQRSDLVNRFSRETQLAGQMDHPNVVRATDAGEKNGVFYLVMEYLSGVDLARLTAQHGKLAPADACELIRQTAVGLEYIHQTLVHRDIKPSNLMLTTSGLVKILDLGLARFTMAEIGEAEQTPSGFAVGTYDYMAPEQTGGAAVPIDGRADIYSLGCTLYRLLTGRAPFSGQEYSSVAKKLYAHCHLTLDVLEDFRSIPEALTVVLLRMTAKDPAGRFASAREVAQALAPLAADSQYVRLLDKVEPIAETPVRPLPPALPEELGRLSAADFALPATQLMARRRPNRRILIAGVAACVTAALALLVVPAVLKRLDKDPGERTGSPSTEIAGLRPLDSLALRTYHPLFDRAPFLAGGTGELRRWRWDEGQQNLEVKGGSSTLFLLGTTPRTQFTFEVGIEQTPWTGRVGALWGYHEDAAAREARKPGSEFAWFQMLVVWQTTDARGEVHPTVRRGTGTQMYNDFGEVRTSTHYGQQQEVPRLSGERILVVDVQRDRLARALLGSAELPLLCSKSVHEEYKNMPHRGGLGVVCLGHSATFANARFYVRSSE